MSVTIEIMNQKISELASLRSEEAEASRIKKEITEKVENLENEIIEMLTAEGLTTFSGEKGKIVVAFRTSVKTPKTPEDKEAFYTYLKNRGLYDSMISVNSQTLNSLYKAEFEEAMNRGESDFAIPGLKEVTLTPSLRFSRT